MKRIEIDIEGVKYPCFPTAGAMLFFKQTTGKEVTEFDPSQFSELFTFFYCTVRAACVRERVAFPFKDAEEFGCMVDPEVLQAWGAEVQGASLLEVEEGAADGEQKKSR